jgi:hypothetical protein
VIYKRPGIYKSDAYQRYGVNAGGVGIYKLPYDAPQKWTKTNVPAGVQTLHDFGDGAGLVPAVPLDSAGISKELAKIDSYEMYKDSVGISKELAKIDSYEMYKDSVGISKEIINVEEV